MNRGKLQLEILEDRTAPAVLAVHLHALPGPRQAMLDALTATEAGSSDRAEAAKIILVKLEAKPQPVPARKIRQDNSPAMALSRNSSSERVKPMPPPPPRMKKTPVALPVIEELTPVPVPTPEQEGDISGEDD